MNRLIESMSAAQIRALPTTDFLIVASLIADSDPVLRTFAASEWDELHDDGKLWVAAIIRETLAFAKERRQ